MLHGQDSIDPDTRFIVFSTLLGASIVGTLIFCLLIHPWTGKPLRPPVEGNEMYEGLTRNSESYLADLLICDLVMNMNTKDQNKL